MRSYQIARLGEKIVSEILKGCNWINKDHDQHEFYDIEYKGIKIDVKTTTVRYKVYRMGELIKDYFNFTQAGQRDSEKIKIYMGIDIDEKGNQVNRFWVREEDVYGNYKLTDEAMNEEELYKYFCQ